MALVEETLMSAWPEHLADLKPPTPFARLNYNEAMRDYGNDKPDMRIPWRIEDCTQTLGFLRGSNANNDWVARLIVCKGQLKVNRTAAKKEFKRILDMNKLSRPFAIFDRTKDVWFKKIDKNELITHFLIDEEDCVVFSWGDEEGVQWTLGQLRNFVADAGGLRKQRRASQFFFLQKEKTCLIRKIGCSKCFGACEPSNDKFVDFSSVLFDDIMICAHWIVNFPLFSVEDDKLVATHHPFTAPIEEHKQWLDDSTKISNIVGQHYDLVMNGVELGGGSIRIHNSKEQAKVLEILGQDTQEMSHLLDALSFGSPPHGGFALGLDRYIALLVGEGDPSVPVRDVIAFPKSKDGRDFVSKAPVRPTDEQLKRYGVQFVEEEEDLKNVLET
uniref:tRNA-synt_2 domain-containing protein n=1 Tax=Angiostrongylus cantonensis TaxID=6313 RepID=A0A0K0CVW3_ANGCA